MYLQLPTTGLSKAIIAAVIWLEFSANGIILRLVTLGSESTIVHQRYCGSSAAQVFDNWKVQPPLVLLVRVRWGNRVFLLDYRRFVGLGFTSPKAIETRLGADFDEMAW